jgi:hypothetical protein
MATARVRIGFFACRVEKVSGSRVADLDTATLPASNGLGDWDGTTEQAEPAGCQMPPAMTLVTLRHGCQH